MEDRKGRRKEKVVLKRFSFSHLMTFRRKRRGGRTDTNQHKIHKIHNSEREREREINSVVDECEPREMHDD